MGPATGLRCLYGPLKAHNKTSIYVGFVRTRVPASYYSSISTTATTATTAAIEKPRLDLDAKYSPSAIEGGWYEYWKSRGLLEAGVAKGRLELETSPKEPIRMLLPPPNVTGELHIGHALMLSIQDALARFYRMQGHPVIWRPGTDHAGIATQTVVERHLKLSSRSKLGRENLLDKIESWRKTYGGKILQQMERMGSSADPALEYYTLSKDLSEVVAKAFVKLHQEGLIYRSTRMVNWSVKAGTALSEIELVSNEFGPEAEVEGAKFGVLYKVAYKVVEDPNGQEIVVSTTRPETIFGDRAIGVHPEDSRYTNLHYKFVQHPLLPDVQLPIIPDAELVDPDFGTGAVKITPAHDANDFEFWKRHSTFAPQKEDSSSNAKPHTRFPIPIVRVFGTDGKMLHSTNPTVVGMDRLHARQQVVYLIHAAQAYRGKTMHRVRLSQCSRTGCVIEPMLCPQWFLRTQPLAENVLSKGMLTAKDREEKLEDAEENEKEKDEQIEELQGSGLLIRPKKYRAEWKRWLEDIQDWCLSRQIWWGHQIPAWRVIDPMDEASSRKNREEISGIDGERWIVALTEEEARAQLPPNEQHLELIQDEDVLDTWFSSGLLPLSTAGWTGSNDSTEQWQKNYPLTFIESGNDILFFWLARMAMLCTWFSGKLPFNEILLHPLVCDSMGRKMSKSVGNVLDPLAIIEGRTTQEVKAEIKAEGFEMVSAMKSQFHIENSAKDIEKITEKVRNTIKAKAKLLPKGIIESGADSLRMTLLDYMKQSRYIPFDVGNVDNFRRLGIKLYNLFKYFQRLRQPSSSSFSSSSSPSSPSDEHVVLQSISEEFRSKLKLHDLYMLYHLRCTVITCNTAFEHRNLHQAVDALRVFIYEYLGNLYVMYIKPELEAAAAAAAAASSPSSSPPSSSPPSSSPPSSSPPSSSPPSSSSSPSSSPSSSSPSAPVSHSNSPDSLATEGAKDGVKMEVQAVGKDQIQNHDDPQSRVKMIIALTTFALDTVIRLAHPFIPYLTEGLWQILDPHTRQNIDGTSIMTQPYPLPQDILEIMPKEIASMDSVIELTEVLRSSKQLDPKKIEEEGGWLRVVVMGNSEKVSEGEHGQEEEKRVIKEYEAQIAKLAKLSKALKVVEKAGGEAEKKILAGDLPKGVSIAIRDEEVGEDGSRRPGWWVLFQKKEQEVVDV